MHWVPEAWPLSPGAVLERKPAKPQEGRPGPPRAPKAQGTAGRGRKDDAGARRKGVRRSHKLLRHPRLKGKPKVSLSLGLTSTFSLAVAKTGHSSQNLSW